MLLIITTHLFCFSTLSFFFANLNVCILFKLALNRHACTEFYFILLTLFFAMSCFAFFHHALGILYQLILSATLGLILWGGSGGKGRALVVSVCVDVCCIVSVLYCCA